MMSLADEKIKRIDNSLFDMEEFKLKDLKRECSKLEKLLRPDELKDYLLYKHEHYVMKSMEGLGGVDLSLSVYEECLEYLKRYQEK
jgi:hypothetical protein